MAPLPPPWLLLCLHINKLSTYCREGKTRALIHEVANSINAAIKIAVFKEITAALILFRQKLYLWRGAKYWRSWSVRLQWQITFKFSFRRLFLWNSSRRVFVSLVDTVMKHVRICFAQIYAFLWLRFLFSVFYSICAFAIWNAHDWLLYPHFIYFAKLDLAQIAPLPFLC